MSQRESSAYGTDFYPATRRQDPDVDTRGEFSREAWNEPIQKRLGNKAAISEDGSLAFYSLSEPIYPHDWLKQYSVSAEKVAQHIQQMDEKDRLPYALELQQAVKDNEKLEPWNSRIKMEVNQTADHKLESIVIDQGVDSPHGLVLIQKERTLYDPVGVAECTSELRSEKQDRERRHKLFGNFDLMDLFDH